MQTITFKKSKQKLAVLWFLGAVFLLIILVIQTFGHKHDGTSNDIWNWLIAAIFPTLALIVGGLVAGAESDGTKTADVFMYRLAFWVSLFYLLVLVAVFLAQPLTGKSLLEVISSFSIFITAFQGIVSAILGMFFVKS